MQPLSVRGQQPHRQRLHRRSANTLCMEGRDRPARHFPDLQSAPDALAVVWRQSGGRHGIDPPEFCMHGWPAALSRLSRHRLANLMRARGHVVDAVPESLGVEHRAAHDERKPPSRADLTHESHGILQKIGGAVGLTNVTDVDQMVRAYRPFLLRRLCRADVHAPVDKRRIHGDDLNVMTSGDLQRKSGLAARRRPKNHQRLRLLPAFMQDLFNRVHHLPLMKSLSKSVSVICRHVGRPWLHWSARSVSSMSLRSLSISGRVRRRCARTEP